MLLTYLLYTSSIQTEITYIQENVSYIGAKVALQMFFISGPSFPGIHFRVYN